MPWSDDDQQRAELAILEGLSDRLELYGIDGEIDGLPVIDDDPRVIASMATENVGNRRHPQGPHRTGRRLRRALVSGRYDRWTTLVWRLELAARTARSAERVAGMTAPVGNRAQRRAAARRKRR